MQIPNLKSTLKVALNYTKKVGRMRDWTTSLGLFSPNYYIPTSETASEIAWEQQGANFTWELEDWLK